MPFQRFFWVALLAALAVVGVEQSVDYVADRGVLAIEGVGVHLLRLEGWEITEI